VRFNSFRDPFVILIGSAPLAMFGALIFTGDEAGADRTKGSGGGLREFTSIRYEEGIPAPQLTQMRLIEHLTAFGGYRYEDHELGKDECFDGYSHCGSNRL
jgi:hypothetical protein